MSAMGSKLVEVAVSANLRSTLASRAQVANLPQVVVPTLRTLVRRTLALHDALAARLRAFAAEPVQPAPESERAPTVPEYTQERLAAAEQRALDTERMIRLLEADIASTRAATEAIRAEREQLEAEHDTEERAAVQRAWLLRRLAGESVQ